MRRIPGLHNWRRALTQILLRLAADLCPPPADADKEKTPVLEKLRGLAFEGVANELKNPSEDEQGERVGPQAMEEDAGDKKWDREQDGRDAQRVTRPVYGVLVAGGVL